MVEACDLDLDRSWTRHVASRCMIDHLAIGVRDLAASRAFYEAALAPLATAS